MPIHKLPNIVNFLLFRVFFNARFYYPIFAVLFLDFGLSLSEFAASNLIWAATIVCLEVPSGALADIIGRKKLVVLAAFLMVCEMLVLLVAQPNSGDKLLFLFCLNRFLSGAGEAMASGADEALAYDSLVEAGVEGRWSEVLEWQSKLSSVAFFSVMLIGAAVYDPNLMSQCAHFLGFEVALTKSDTLKLPIWLTLFHGIIALGAAITMTPLESESQVHSPADKLALNPWQQVKQVAIRLFQRKEILAVIFAVVLFDQAARASMTMASKTFSAYGVEEAWFGVVGAVFALLGAFIARPARWLVENRSQRFIFCLLVLASALGLFGQAWGRGLWALFFIACLSMVMSALGFFASYYLNKLSASAERATLLSFKGLVCNIGFGLVSLYYAGVSSVWSVTSDSSYLESLYSLPVYLGFWLIIYLIWYRRSFKADHPLDSRRGLSP